MNFISPEVVNAQFEELQKIVDDLIIVSDDGSCRPRPGVSDAQMLYALEEMKKIKVSFEEIGNRREKYNKDLDAHLNNIEKVKKDGQRFLDKYGKNFFPAWYKKLLNL